MAAHRFVVAALAALLLASCSATTTCSSSDAASTVPANTVTATLKTPWAHQANAAGPGTRVSGSGWRTVSSQQPSGSSAGPSASAPWFAPVFFAKLLAGHVAGAALLPTDPLSRGAGAAPAR